MAFFDNLAGVDHCGDHGVNRNPGLGADRGADRGADHGVSFSMSCNVASGLAFVTVLFNLFRGVDHSFNSGL